MFFQTDSKILHSYTHFFQFHLTTNFTHVICPFENFHQLFSQSFQFIQTSFVYFYYFFCCLFVIETFFHFSINHVCLQFHSQAHEPAKKLNFLFCSCFQNRLNCSKFSWRWQISISSSPVSWDSVVCHEAIFFYVFFHLKWKTSCYRTVIKMTSRWIVSSIMGWLRQTSRKIFNKICRC